MPLLFWFDPFLEVRAEIEKKIFVLLVQMRTRKFAFEINWLYEIVLKNISWTQTHDTLSQFRYGTTTTIWNKQLLLQTCKYCTNNRIKWFNSFSITHFSFDVTRSLAQAHWFSRSTDRFDPSSRFLFQAIFSPLDITMWPLWLASLIHLETDFGFFLHTLMICDESAKREQKISKSLVWCHQN